MSPEWEGRYYSFDSEWGPGEQMASMRNGSGDEWSIVFSPDGVFVRGFDHESGMSPAVNGNRLWPGLIDGLPAVFEPFAAEPVFSDGAHPVGDCVRCATLRDDRWQVGEIAYPPSDRNPMVPTPSLGPY